MKMKMSENIYTTHLKKKKSMHVSTQSEFIITVLQLCPVCCNIKYLYVKWVNFRTEW